MPMLDPERAAFMENLAKQLDGTVDRLNHALDRQGELATEIGSVRRRGHWLLGGIAATLAVGLLAGVAAWSAFQNSSQNSEILATQAADRAAVERGSCIVRNASTLSTDVRFNSMFDALGTVVSPESQDVVEVLRNAGVTPISQRYRDCDGDGTIADAGDFPEDFASIAPGGP